MTDRWYVRFLLAAALVSFAGRAQIFTGNAPGAQSRPFYTLTGTVYDSVSNAPIAHALVQLPGKANASAFTNADGRFEIPRVPAGNVSLAAEKPGYFSAQALSDGAPLGAQGDNFTLSEDSTDVRLKLIPEGHIEGRITNSDNEPVARLQVWVIGSQIVEGWKRETPAGSASTNAAGRFRVGGLKPGRYYLRTGSVQMFRSAGPDSGVNIGYPERFYPGAPDQASAQSIDVRAGETAEADMQLPFGRFYQVSGTVVGDSSPNNVFVGISTDWGGGMGGSGIDPKTGRFKIRDVFPGVWKLVAQSNMGPNGAGSAYGELEVRVTDSDVNDVQIEVRPGIRIPLQVDLPESSQNQTPGNYMPPVQLISISHQASRQMNIWPEIDNSTPQPTRFFANVQPGEYRVSAQQFMQGMCVDSITSGNVDLTRDTLNVQAGITPQPIHVVFGAACAKLSGRVSDPDGNGKGAVLLLPSSAKAASPVVIGISPDKSFSMQGLSPGNYRVFAINNLVGLEYANPRALAAIPSEEVHLDANQTATVNIDLYRREAQ